MKKFAALLCALMMVCLAVPALADTLVMATNASFPPYEFYDGETVTGIDVEIATAICAKLGYELQVDDMEFDSIISAVQSGKADFGMAGMTVTEERAQMISFSNSYATGIQAVIVPADGPIQSIDDLSAEGAFFTIGVQMATTGDLYATWDFADAGKGEVLPYSNGNEAVLALKNGKVDFVLIDNEPAKAYVAANEGLKILDTEYAVEDYAACIAKDNTDLLEKFNAALQELIDDGTVAAIITKYIPAE